MSKELHLSDVDGDTLWIDTADAAMLDHPTFVRVSINLERPSDLAGRTVHLTHKQARELFNWLGVQLHKGGE